MKRVIITLLLITAFLVPVTASATTVKEFKPIVPIPGISQSDGSYRSISFPEYVNQLFRLSMSIGAILAVLMFIYGGFEYMTGVSGKDKKGGLDRIRGAVIGLLLLLSVFILLTLINPCITNITALTGEVSCGAPPNPDPGAPSQTNTGSGTTQSTERREVEIGVTSCVGTVAEPPSGCVNPVAVCITQQYQWLEKGTNACRQGEREGVLCTSCTIPSIDD